MFVMAGGHFVLEGDDCILERYCYFFCNQQQHGTNQGLPVRGRGGRTTQGPRVG